jgi:hypothetical protein
MKPEELEGLKKGDVLLNMIMSESEIETIKKEVAKHMDEVKKLACTFE